MHEMAETQQQEEAAAAAAAAFATLSLSLHLCSCFSGRAQLSIANVAIVATAESDG